jgi:putative copper export protein/methionine-rich copper-binding protein CopC/mono/diheme cytochrome c family protein
MPLRRALILLIGLVLGVGLLGARVESAGAHATLGSSDPPANEIIATSPGRVELRFTEPVEEIYTKIILVDQNGAEVPGTSTTVDSSDATLARMVIPDDLPRGTYSVVWRTLSAADGHRFSGYFAFTIGTTSDVRTVIPPTFDDSGGTPFWLSTAVRWFVFVTLSALAGIWLTWLVAIRPALGPVWQAAPLILPRVRRYALVAGLLYLAGAAMALFVQVDGQAEGDWLGTLGDTLRDTRWGQWWTLRVVYGALITLVFPVAAWWWPRRRLTITLGLLLLSALLPLPHALISHASATNPGHQEAVAADYVHLLAMGVWAGGLGTLIVVLTTGGALESAGRRAVLARAIPRFSAIALTCWVALGLTGLYSAWLQVGAIDGLFDTRYGRALIYKLLILAVVLVIAATNLTIVSRRVRQSAPAAGDAWWRRFGALVALELIGVIAALIFVGRMTALEPARPVLAERENQREISLRLDDRNATLTFAPGTAGPNHIRLDLEGGALAESATVSILLAPPIDLAGQSSITLERAAPNTWEAHTAEMSVVGEWTMTVTVSQTGAFQWSTDITYPVAERKLGGGMVNIPSWTFKRSGLVGFLAAMAGVVALVIGWRAGSRSLRREAVALGAVAILAGALLMVTGRSDAYSAGIPLNTPNPLPHTDAVVEVGRLSYQANCIACHGAGGAGDGPFGQGMEPPPANLLEGHALFHSDAEFFNWIRNGKPGTGMPAFSDSLTDDEIWSTIHYLRELQGEHAHGDATPENHEATPTP